MTDDQLTRLTRLLQSASTHEREKAGRAEERSRQRGRRGDRLDRVTFWQSARRHRKQAGEFDKLADQVGPKIGKN